MATNKSKAGGDLGPGTAIGNSGAAATPGKSGRPASQKATGQQVSLERGSATRSKKNPGKRPKQGGS